MNLHKDHQLLRIYLGENDYLDGKLRYQQIVNKAREMGISGATVLRGILGYGALGEIHSAKILRLSEDLPIVIEIVDTISEIERFLPVLDDMMSEGVITRHDIEVAYFRRE